jgi:hypothetical protein
MKSTIINLIGAGALTAALFAFTAPRPDVTHSTYGQPSNSLVRHLPGSSNAMTSAAPAAIKGKVDPQDAAAYVVAVSDMDSVRSAINDGMFMINTKPGSYKVVVVAKAPYKDAVKDNVQVADGTTTDLGTISLQQ